MAKPSLALIPSGYANNKVFSVLPSNGDGDFDFTRGSAATRLNSQGLIETVSSNTPRLNYPLLDGVVSGCPSLLLEPSRTNILPRSEDIDTGWSKLNVTVANNQTVSPDGTLNAALITVTSANSQHASYNTLSSSVTSGQPYYISCFVKKYNSKYIRLVEGYTGAKLNFNLDDGTYDLNNGSSDAIVEAFDNGWYRIGFKFTPTTTNSQFALYIKNNSNETSYTGNGEAVYIWGAQLEQGSYPTSYIPTNGEANGVTRLAETCNGAGTSDTFNDSEGVFMVEMSFLSQISSPNQRLAISDGTTSNRILIQNIGSTANRLQFYTIVNNVISTDFYADVNDITSFNKIAFKYKENDFSIWINGVKILTDINGVTYPIGTLTELSFDGGDGANDFYGNVKQVQYFDTALTDQELQELTQV